MMTLENPLTSSLSLLERDDLEGSKFSWVTIRGYKFLY